MQKYDNKRVIKDLIDLGYAQGLHSGRWEDELSMDDSSEEYLATMILFAEEYDIEYDKDLSNYIEDENESKCYAMDSMGFTIYLAVKDKLVNILLNDLM